MPHQPEIWTGDVRRVLYAMLVKKFGPSESWEFTGSPGKGRDEEFSAFCDAFSIVVGAKSGDAVQHQIRFAMPEIQDPTNWGRHAQTAILNKAAALETGFIRDRQLPDLVAVGRTAGHEEQ